LNNLPVDQLAPLGANVTIAVDVGFQLADQHPERQIPILRSLPEVAAEFYQAGAMMVAEITKNTLKASPPNLLLRPDLPAGIGILSGFVKPRDIIDRGEQATEQSLEQIRYLLRPSLQSWFQSLRYSQSRR
jgi:predicted acylesterase/phospholipase RssA